MTARLSLEDVQKIDEMVGEFRVMQMDEVLDILRPVVESGTIWRTHCDAMWLASLCIQAGYLTQE